MSTDGAGARGGREPDTADGRGRGSGAGSDPAPGSSSGPRPVARSAGPESGGEPACLLHLLCPECGCLPDDRTAPTCPRCDTPLPTA